MPYVSKKRRKNKRGIDQKWINTGIAALFMLALVAGIYAFVPKGPPPVDPAVEQAHAERLATAEAERERKAKAAEDAKKVHIAFPKDRRLKVFFAGDSLGSGYYSSVREKAYRPLVVKHLEQFGAVEEIRATKPASEPLFQIVNVEGVPKNNIDLAIIELGTNDAGRTELPEFREAYQGLIDDIRKGSPDAQIICAGVWGGSGSHRGTYDSAIREICLANDARYVDLTAKFMLGDTYGPEGRDSWAGPSDDFHPNDKGHQAIADLLIERISVDG